MSKAQYNLKTKTDNAKFLQLVSDNVIEAALKTYSDTVLFYYLGHLAICNTPGDIVEIGVGGSTYPLIELAEIYNKIFVIIDVDKNRTDLYADSAHWPNAKLEKILIDSKQLSSHQTTSQFSYCHIDADKNFTNTISDIEFCLDRLTTNGLICQDDYGNHKWPTVTDAVKDLEFRGKIKLIFVGDSSVWFTKPEYYEYWMLLLEKDYEYSLLVALCNISNSKVLGKTPAYFFMNTLLNTCRKSDYSEFELDYFNKMIQLYPMASLDYYSRQTRFAYLKMPYLGQSRFGKFLDMVENLKYMLTDSYRKVKGIDWPEHVPTNKKEIQQLPDWIKSELKTVHKIDIYEKVKKTIG
jgi:hypothetical protein